MSNSQIVGYTEPGERPYGRYPAVLSVHREQSGDVSARIRDERGMWLIVDIPAVQWKDMVYHLAKEAGLIGPTGDED